MAEEQLPIIELNHVHMVFNMASEQLTNLKEYFIKLAKHQLFFREFVALDDVNFDIYPGERYGFVGVNGSGKSTLLKIIAGVLEPTTGSCKTYGTLAPLIELGAGFDVDLTARENTYLNGALLGYSKQFIDEHFDEIIDFAEVRDFRGHAPEELFVRHGGTHRLRHRHGNRARHPSGGRSAFGGRLHVPAEMRETHQRIG